MKSEPRDFSGVVPCTRRKVASMYTKRFVPPHDA